MNHLDIGTVRTQALFASVMQPLDNPDAGQVQQAIAGAVRQYGSRGCAARMAQEFGDHPELAVMRMRWARRMVEETFGATRAAAAAARSRVPSRVVRTPCAA